MVKAVFPDAVEHRKLRMTNDDNDGVPVFEDDGCSLCHKEKDLMKFLKSGIERWSRDTRDNPTLKKLLDGNRTMTREIAVHNFTRAENGCRLVHCDDISSWRKMVTSAAKPYKRKFADSDEFKSYVENLAFPSYHAVVLDFERQPAERLLQSLRSLICRQHKLVIKSAVFQQGVKDGSGQQDHLLSTSICVLSDDEHNAFISSLSELLTILTEGSESSHGVDYDPADNGYKVNDIHSITRRSYHPAITIRPESEATLTDDVLLFCLDGSTKEFVLSHGVCACETCSKEYGPLHQKNQAEQEDCVDNVSEDSFEKGHVGKMGSIASDPIVLESDNEDEKNTRKLRVFGFKAESSVGNAIDSLREALGSPHNGETETQEPSYLRRSTRKRKTRYPIGCILREDSIEATLDHNMAALRLLLYEKCEIPLSDSNYYIVDLKNGDPLIIHIPLTMNEKSLQEMVNGVNRPHRDDLHTFENIVIMYQMREKVESSHVNATLMDSLIQAANLDSSNGKRDGNIKTKRQSERGFQGTLLQSSSSAVASNVSSEPTVDKDVSAVAKIEKRALSDIIKVPEDDQDDRIQSENPHDRHEVWADSSDDSILEKHFRNPSRPSSASRSGDECIPSEPKNRPSMTKGSAEHSADQDLNELKPVVQERSLGGFVEENRTRRDEGISMNRSCASSTSSSQLAIEEYSRPNAEENVEDMDERAVVDESSAAPSSRRPASPEKDMTLKDTSEQAEKMNFISMLTARLQKTANIRDQLACWDAVAWAIENNPHRDEPEIVDCAYAKLLNDDEDE
jgi:hypothetical protein